MEYITHTLTHVCVCTSHACAASPPACPAACQRRQEDNPLHQQLAAPQCSLSCRCLVQTWYPIAYAHITAQDPLLASSRQRAPCVPAPRGFGSIALAVPRPPHNLAIAKPQWGRSGAKVSTTHGSNDHAFTWRRVAYAVQHRAPHHTRSHKAAARPNLLEQSRTNPRQLQHALHSKRHASHTRASHTRTRFDRKTPASLCCIATRLPRLLPHPPGWLPGLVARRCSPPSCCWQHCQRHRWPPRQSGRRPPHAAG